MRGFWKGPTFPKAASRLHLEGEVSHLFGGPGCPQEHRLCKMVAHDLFDGGGPHRETSRNTYGRDAGEVRGDGADVAGVHGERVVHFLPDLERHRGCRRREQYVIAGEGRPEVLDYSGTDLLRLGVIGVVVARRQGVGAKHDPSLRLVPKALLTSLAVHLVHTVLGDSQTVAHAVETGEVRGDLGR